jgi:hypothetical protein
MTIPLILKQAPAIGCFPSSLKKPFSIAACNAALITANPKLKISPAGRAIVSRARGPLSSEHRYRGQMPFLMIQSRFRSRNREKDSGFSESRVLSGS